jgi:ElaB/YqjD/DUF883 family membrane-anchored ribosome-binding protein
MDINEINNEIDSLIRELNTLVKSLANSRELIAEDNFKRATNYLSETEIALKQSQEKYLRLNYLFEGKVVTSETSIQILSPGS